MSHFSARKRVYVVEIPHQRPPEIWEATKARIVELAQDKGDEVFRARSFDKYFEHLTRDNSGAKYFESKQALKRYVEIYSGHQCDRVRSAFKRYFREDA